MEQEQTPKQVQPEDTKTISIEERDAKREFNIIMCCTHGARKNCTQETGNHMRDSVEHRQEAWQTRI